MKNDNTEKENMTMSKKELKTLKRKRKLAERQRKVRQSPIAQATCLDCGEFCFVHEDYVVKNEVWKEAGFNGWDSGYLHLACLEKRLGRKVTEEELLYWSVGESPDGDGWVFQTRPEYYSRPEFLDTGDALTPQQLEYVKRRNYRCTIRRASLKKLPIAQ